jgi:hypothetical protein
MEADQVTLYNESLQELELEESKTLIAILKERVAKLEQVVSSGNSELIHLANQLKVERQQHEALQSENDLMKVRQKPFKLRLSVHCEIPILYIPYRMHNIICRI